MRQPRKKKSGLDGSTSWTDLHRSERRHDDGERDQRSAFQRDRDRILYSSAFRRLAGVSQVVSADHVEPFHNRLTHTVKVAQLGRRLAETLEREQPELALRAGLHPEVVEAACFAHDLGHPPFGHAGEDTLNTLVDDAGDPEGYEGNAQSFRILTKLALRSPNSDGLDLCRAVLVATIKYPWSHRSALRRGSKKFGYYRSEADDYNFARSFHQQTEERTLEAAIMDYADDIAYSVHDLEDFHRIRAFPWQSFAPRQTSPEIVIDEPVARDLVQITVRSWYGAPADVQERVQKAASVVFNSVRKYPEIYDEPYDGTRLQRIALRDWTSQTIRRFMRDCHPTIVLNDAGFPRLQLHPEAEAQIRFLKQITRSFIIEGPSICSQQLGHARIVRDVYADVVEEIKTHRSKGMKLRIIPRRFFHLIQDSKDAVTSARLAADCLASLTECELINFHRRLRGTYAGSIADPIIR